MRHFILKSAGALSCAAIVAMAGCDNTTSVGGGAGGSGGGSGGAAGGIPSIGDVDKVDILFMVDNSRSMADKQQVISKST